MYIKIGQKLKPAKVIFHRPPKTEQPSSIPDKAEPATARGKESGKPSIKKPETADRTKANEKVDPSQKLDVNNFGFSLPSSNFKQTEGDKATFKPSGSAARKSKSSTKPEIVIENTILPPGTSQCSESGPTNFKCVLSAEIKPTKDRKNESDASGTSAGFSLDSKATGATKTNDVVSSAASLMPEGASVRKGGDLSSGHASTGSSKSQGDGCRKRKLNVHNKSAKVTKCDSDNDGAEKQAVRVEGESAASAGTWSR